MATKKTSTPETGLSVVKRQTTIATQQATDLVVKTEEDYAVASDLLGKIKKVQKLVKQEKDKVLGPLLEAERAERGRWKPVEEDAANAESIIKNKMVTFVNQKEAQRQKEEAKIQEKLETGKISMDKAATQMEKVTQAPSQVGASTVRKVRNVYVVDEALIPRQYLQVDMVKVRKDALAGVTIPGVEVREENSIASSAR